MMNGGGRPPFLAELLPGTKLALGPDARAAVMYVVSGEEFALKGPGEFVVAREGVNAVEGRCALQPRSRASRERHRGRRDVEGGDREPADAQRARAEGRSHGSPLPGERPHRHAPADAALGGRGRDDVFGGRDLPRGKGSLPGRHQGTLASPAVPPRRRARPTRGPIRPERRRSATPASRPCLRTRSQPRTRRGPARSRSPIASCSRWCCRTWARPRMRAKSGPSSPPSVRISPSWPAWPAERARARVDGALGAPS